MQRSAQWFVGVLVALGVSWAYAADRPAITFADGRIFPENVTSTKDGTLYIGSLGHDNVYRAGPSSSTATAWIPPRANGLETVLGVLADEATDTLWVCFTVGGGRAGIPKSGDTGLKAYSLKSAAFKASFTFPGKGTCNDIAVANDGTVYATDTPGARVLRLKKGGNAFEPWAADAKQLAAADGIAILGDGAVYVNSIALGTLIRIPVAADGSAGPLTTLQTSRPLQAPDGMRASGAKTLLVVEGPGRLAEATIDGTRAEIRTIREGLIAPAGVTVAGGMAYVTEARLGDRTESGPDPGPFKVVGVPYQPSAR